MRQRAAPEQVLGGRVALRRPRQVAHEVTPLLAAQALPLPAVAVDEAAEGRS